MTAEESINKMLRKYPIAVELSDKALKLHVREYRVSGLLVGVRNGYLRVRIDGHKTAGIYHPDFWRAA